MSDTAKTVVIKTANGPVRINESDYDEKVHTLHSKGEQEKNAEPVQTTQTAPQLAEGLQMPAAPSAPDLGTAGGNAPDVPSPNQRLVAKDGKRFYVVGADGKRLTEAGLDADKGYGTEQDAWNAALALQH